MNISNQSFHAAHGALPYTLTNDYLFRAILQENNSVLKGLICSLLHLSPKEILSVTIQNPIALGKSIDHKSFILDFTLFPEHPEFYSTYALLNVKNNTVYSDKFKLSVLNLNQIELATENDKLYHTNYWAKLFKATTWEEIKMLATKNRYIQEASESLFELCAADEIREQCEAREEYYRMERTLQSEHQTLVNNLQTTEYKLADTKNKLVDAQNELTNTQNELADTQDELANAQNELEQIRLENERLKAQIKALQTT